MAKLAKTPRLNRFFFQQNFQAATLNQCGVNQNTCKYRWKSRQKLRNTFHAQPGWPYWHVIFPFFFVFLVSAYCSGECCFLPGQCL